jgi:hypothetical protein
VDTEPEASGFTLMPRCLDVAEHMMALHYYLYSCPSVNHQENWFLHF